jgi:DNA repair protein RadC
MIENYQINDFAKISEHPKERLMKVGEQFLSVAELLEIIFQTGRRNTKKNLLVKSLLNQYQSLYLLKKASLEELQEIQGMGLSKAILLKSAIELGRRVQISSQEYENKVYSSFDLGQRMIEKMKDLDQEHFIVIFLNIKNFIIKEKTIFIGSLNQSVAHPREILREALKIGAASIILVHNHPSGISTPSREDLLITERIAQGSYTIGINLIDHLVIGNGNYYSMREKNKIKFFKRS